MLSVNEVFAKARDAYKQNFQMLLPLGFLWAVLSGIVQYVTGVPSNKPVDILIIKSLFLGSFVLAVPQIMLLYVGAKIFKGRVVAKEQLWTIVRDTFLMYVLISAMMQVITFLGVLLFVVPGIYFGVIFVFADMIWIFERRPFADCFSASAILVRGRFWKVFLVHMSLSIIVMFPAVILGRFWGSLWAAFGIPFYCLGRVAIYDALKMTSKIADQI